MTIVEPVPSPRSPDPTIEPAISVRGLTKHFGTIAAVDSLDLDVPAGSVFGLIGPNGAGKSTTFAILATLLKPTSGTVRVAGHDPVTAPFEVRRRLGYMPDVMGVYDNLRVDEYLEFFAAAYRVPRDVWPDLVSGLLELVDLGGKQDASVDSLSRGMKQRLSLARALVHDPEVLILDEPASGLDPRARVELRNLVHALRDMGKTVVISSHILAELEEMCTDIAILEAGRLVASGTPKDIVASIGGGRRIAVRFADGTDEIFTVADDDEQIALLRRLVEDEGRAVLEFADEGNLESLFLSVTKGIVQ